MIFSLIDYDLSIAQNSEERKDNKRQFTANAQPLAKMVLSGNVAINWKLLKIQTIHQKT